MILDMTYIANTSDSVNPSPKIENSLVFYLPFLNSQAWPYSNVNKKTLKYMNT